MTRNLLLLNAALLCILAAPAFGQEAASSLPKPPPSGTDYRQQVDMPEQARQLMQREMLDHIATLNEIIVYLADNRLAQAADIAETRMGMSSMGKHRSSGMGPGRYMPLAMRDIGWSMHEAASEFADIARKGDREGAYNALQKISSACVACHYSFRTR